MTVGGSVSAFAGSRAGRLRGYGFIIAAAAIFGSIGALIVVAGPLMVVSNSARSGSMEKQFA